MGVESARSRMPRKNNNELQANGCDIWVTKVFWNAWYHHLKIIHLKKRFNDLLNNFFDTFEFKKGGNIFNKPKCVKNYSHRKNVFSGSFAVVMISFFIKISKFFETIVLPGQILNGGRGRGDMKFEICLQRPN